jgi:hypothetical protein
MMLFAALVEQSDYNLRRLADYEVTMHDEPVSCAQRFARRKTAQDFT